MSLGTWVRVTAGFVGIAVASVAGLLYVYQSALVYPSTFPEGSRTHVDTPDSLDMPYTEHRLTTPDRVKLHVYAMSHEDDASRPTVILFHANAGNMGHRLPIALQFYKRMGCHVVMLSYRGYGLSTGDPTEAGLRIDAQTVLDWVRSNEKLRSSKILVYGQSIGGAVAIDLAARNPSTVRCTCAYALGPYFLSIPLLIPSVLPVLRHFTFLCRMYPIILRAGEIWPSNEAIQRIPASTPILFLSGANDELVPPAHMKKLYELSVSTAKEFHTFKDAMHTSEEKAMLNSQTQDLTKHPKEDL
ncbi:hypothetical protein Malapachy_3008 [Malassezia pachydermatis]|uniref:AB hydrolase-1 domain-containing protein n=1 Tax=Malassezia pachydermatis TaxID=77020 RepID=A0A0M8MTP1_9BASI|nr:hypothetical protein Malapachy_3008 [Malassezia pachydermatis]KOS16547.1 hypothetical protein Malapachy_3008 [Malassezia pachydermatis]